MKLARLLFWAVMIGLGAALAIGFWNFTAAVENSAPPAALAKADAIVALTGGSARRLTTGMRLLEQGYGQRLLVSGVNPKVTDEELAALLKGQPETFACCVDIGRAAEDTLGNASETAAWAKAHGFQRLIVVTDDYHMPRSLAELRVALPEASITAYPVPSHLASPKALLRNPGAAALLAGEYVKFVVIGIREALLKADKKTAAKPA